ncbi:hypothetical protein [Nitrosomonas communis]|uniref:hypothetical protein n=1 Tax=Nitrosomonas communis TaxID=44574 RepID=UPI0026EA32E8|nr:hypothetical protein [Nitrosomonas communis]MCO6427122.1 hypothetical protein [Nitrosomonas communis]
MANHNGYMHLTQYHYVRGWVVLNNLILTHLHLLPYACHVAGKIQRSGLEARKLGGLPLLSGFFTSVILW